YYPDRVQSTGYQPAPPSSDVDWSQYVDVVNPAGDDTPPHLSSLKTWRSTIRAGEPEVVLYTTQADASGIASVVISYASPRGTLFEINQQTPGVAAVGPAVRVVPRAGYGGQYKAYAVTVTDGAGNYTMYEADKP